MHICIFNNYQTVKHCNVLVKKLGLYKLKYLYITKIFVFNVEFF